jgi:hypothetical protein
MALILSLFSNSNGMSATFGKCQSGSSNGICEVT